MTLPATDLENSVAFYQRLGLRLIVHAPPRYARLETPEGETPSLHLVDAGVLPPPSARAMVYCEVEDVDNAFRELREAGVSFDAVPVHRRWRWREARLRDPSGNPLCYLPRG